MRGFLLGLVVAGLAFGGYLYWKGTLFPRASRPTAADAGAPPVKDAKEKKKKKRRGAVRVAQGDGPRAGGAGPASAPPMEAEPEPIRLSASDLKLVSQGDDLSRPDVIKLGDATDDSGSRELSQDEID